MSVTRVDKPVEKPEEKPKEKRRLKLLDLVNTEDEVEVAPGDWLGVRPLTLEEMIHLLMNFQGAFLSLYEKALNTGNLEDMDLGAFILAAPALVAKIIAISTDGDEPGMMDKIRTGMAATVQLIALTKIMKISVPDPKKAAELLSVVTAQLRNLRLWRQNELVKNSSPTTSQ